MTSESVVTAVSPIVAACGLLSAIFAALFSIRLIRAQGRRESSSDRAGLRRPTLLMQASLAATMGCLALGELVENGGIGLAACMALAALAAALGALLYTFVRWPSDR